MTKKPVLKVEGGLVQFSKAVENREGGGGGTFIYDIKKAGTMSSFVL